MVLTIIFAILFFSLIIFVHELGHFLTARLFKVKVHEFAIGMGPKIVSWGKKETKYSVRLIPVGGFCKMEGEDEDSDDEGSFSKKPWYARLIILASGAGMNIILGFVVCVVYVLVSSSQGGVPTVTVDSVVETADVASFVEPGDEIVEVNGHNVNIKRDIDFAMMTGNPENCRITVEREGKKLSSDFKPLVAMYTDGTPAYLVGVGLKTEEPGFFNVLHESFFQTIWMGKTVFVSLGMLISGDAKMSDVSGPVGVVDTMVEVGKSGNLAGFINLLFLAALISVNIGIMNLLPIPALDGGRILFVIIEAIRRKPIPPEKEGVVHLIGIILLFGLMIFATWNDIMKLIG